MTLTHDHPSNDMKRLGAAKGNGQRLTRRRIPLSCVACRLRKLKCNREKPCQNCIVRGEGTASSCTYAEKAEKKLATPSNPRSDAEDMRKRLNRLESSIISMLADKKEPAESINFNKAIPTVIEAPEQAGGQKISHDTRSTHWDAILSEIGAMKEAWSEENDKIEYNTTPSLTSKPHRPGLLTGLSAPPDRATILASLPSREASDKLLYNFFNSYNPAIPARYVLHKATFLKQYSQHCADPSKTKIMWIGLLYSIYTISMQSWILAKEIPSEYEGTAPALRELYRVRTVQCLLIADICKPVEFMIETLDLHSFSEYSEEGDGDLGTCLLSGLLMRLALQQGYHRDPSHHPNISIFQGEMRRRIWSAVSQHELLFSVQLGLPKALRYSEADTESPRNLNEEELYEDMTELPPSRPLSEDTEVSYQVVKYQIMRAYGKVIEFLHIIEPQAYDEVLKLDLVLLEARSIIPPHLQVGTLEEMKNDSCSRVAEKYILDIFYHKAVCILHRKYWHALPRDSTAHIWYYSRKACVSSAMAMLAHQFTMHEACKPGGCMLPIKWYHFSITNHDFLLAAMILCLDMMTNLHDSEGYITDCIVTDADKLEMLKKARAIWAEVEDDCRDAKRAVKILTTVLQKLSTKMKELSTTSQKVQCSGNIPVPTPATETSIDMMEKHYYFENGTGHGTPGMVHLPLVPAPNSFSGSSPESDILMQDNFLHNIESCLTVPADFNWDSFDQYMIGQTPEVAGNAYQEMPNDFQSPRNVAKMDRLTFRYPFIAGGHIDHDEPKPL